jgi:hypothetical protein
VNEIPARGLVPARGRTRRWRSWLAPQAVAGAYSRPMRARGRYALFTVLLFATEVLIATRLAHVPFVRGSLGDVLVVMLLYCLVLSIRDVDRLHLAGAVFSFACLVELAQYFELARLLGLRPGSVASIVLGSTFQWTDILCYGVGSIVAVVLDHSGRLLRKRARSPSQKA